LRQDTNVSAEREQFAVAAPTPSGVDPAGAGVSIRSLRHAYGELEAIARLDLDVPEHGVLGVVGPSGCGKSTLLELIAGLQQPSGGTVAVGEAIDPAERLARCAFMPQRDMLLPWLSAIDNAALALRNRGVRRREARAEAGHLFERFGLAGFERTRPAELSGGMRQRAPSSSSPTMSRRRSTSPTASQSSRRARPAWSKSWAPLPPAPPTATPPSPTRSSSPPASARWPPSTRGRSELPVRLSYPTGA